MDSYREHSNDFEAPVDDVAAAIGTDERRMHVRAYNYWVSLLEGRDFPSIEDLEPENVQDFAANSVLLDFTCGRENPAVPYVGGAIRDECDLDDNMRTISQVPSRSLLSRLTDHYLQIIANRAPIGFEAEYVNQRSENICYRGILMPFSSDGDAIDFIYGVINWKTVGGSSATDSPGDLLPVVEQVVDEPEEAEEILGIEAEPLELTHEDHLVWEDGPSAEAGIEAPDLVETAAHPSWDDGPDSDEITPEIDEDAGLADRLWAARETAEAVKSADGRTRVALYRALSLAYDFAIASQQNPEEYAELLEESGVKAQARAPMTPIVKLVFGIDYDKARLTEFAAALSYAQRQQIVLGGFKDFIENQFGGLKALVAAEREARRPEPKADTRGEAARAKLRQAPAMSLADMAVDEEFAVVVARRTNDGSFEPVAVVDDPALVEKAIRKAA
jgi:hypothetical protein